jgi:hypothetical protein
LGLKDTLKSSLIYITIDDDPAPPATNRRRVHTLRVCSNFNEKQRLCLYGTSSAAVNRTVKPYSILRQVCMQRSSTEWHFHTERYTASLNPAIFAIQLGCSWKTYYLAKTYIFLFLKSFFLHYNYTWRLYCLKDKRLTQPQYILTYQPWLLGRELPLGTRQ